jgi:hypothetical protein
MKSSLSLKSVITFLVLLLALLTLTSIATALYSPVICLNENQILYLFSTSAQVIAAIYGLTLSGFIFFRNELSREESEDETLAEAVNELKGRYFNFLLFVTFLVGLTLLLSNLAISLEDSGGAWLNAVTINAGQSSFITSLVATAYFIFDIISPERIERASRALQSKVDPSGAVGINGNLEIFLKTYNKIEQLLGNVGQLYQVTGVSSSTKNFPRPISNARVVEILWRNGKIDKPQFEKLRELITLRNSIVHGADPVVSQEFVTAASNALQDLKLALGET